MRRTAKCFHIACLPGPSSSIFPRSDTAKSIVGPRRNTSVPPIFGRQHKGRSRPGINVILSLRSRHGRHGPSAWSPSWHSFLFLLHVRQAPFLRTSAVSWGALNLRVLRVRIKASGWEDSDRCRRFLGLGFWAFSTGVSERESEEV